MDGLILVNKPVGKTSHDVVDHIRRILAIQKVGHFGTLDPLAKGLLLVAVGKATRLFPFYLNKAKVYKGRIRLGFATDTYDSEGIPASQESNNYPSEKSLQEHMKATEGEIMQLPPPYSAKKYKGEALYKRVRKSKEYVLRPNKIFIHYFRMEKYSSPYINFRVKCSAGTYVRSIAHDLGQKLGCGAHLDRLERTMIGKYSLGKSHTLEDIERLFSSDQVDAFLYPLEVLLPELPKIVVDDLNADQARSGRDISLDSLPPSSFPDGKPSSIDDKSSTIYRIFDSRQKLLAFAQKKLKSDALHPFLVFDPKNSSQ